MVGLIIMHFLSIIWIFKQECHNWNLNTNPSVQSEQEMGSKGVERLESRPYKRSEMILHCLNYDVL